MAQEETVIIVGGGPAGYTAGLYTARAELDPLIVEGFAWGGLLQQTTDVENYPGYPEGVAGPEMMQQFRDQTARFGARFVTDDVTGIELARTGDLHKIWVEEDLYVTRAVILAMGARHKKLGVPGEEELAGRGVSYCATCDAAFFRGAETIVVGGGDSAMEEAMFLAKFASKVTIVHRRNEFRASKIMLERAHRVANIDWLTQYVIEELVSGEGGALEGVRLRDTHGDPVRELSITGAFIAVGHEPQSQLVRGQVDIDPAGYVLTEGKSTRTSYAGVFAAGDLVDHTYRQAVTAAGSGCQAALDAERYLRDAAPVEARRPEADAISSLRSSPAPADLMLPPSEVAAVAADG